MKRRMRVLIGVLFLASVSAILLAADSISWWAGTIPGRDRIWFNEMGVQTFSVSGTASISDLATTDILMVDLTVTGSATVNGSATVHDNVLAVDNSVSTAIHTSTVAADLDIGTTTGLSASTMTLTTDGTINGSLTVHDNVLAVDNAVSTAIHTNTIAADGAIGSTTTITGEHLSSTDDADIAGDLWITGAITDVTLIQADSDFLTTTGLSATTMTITTDAQIYDNLTVYDAVLGVDDSVSSAIHTGTIAADGAIGSTTTITAGTIVQGEHITSTDDADVVGDLWIGGNITDVTEILADSDISTSLGLSASTMTLTADGTINGSLTVHDALLGVDDAVSTAIHTNTIAADGAIGSTTTITAGTTVQGEHVTSTDDADIAGDIWITGSITDVTAINADGAIGTSTTLDVAGDATVDDLIVNSSSTAVLGFADFLMDIATPVWTVTHGVCSPTTGAIRYTTCSIPIHLGTRLDRVGVRYIAADAIGADDMIISVVQTDGDGSVTHLATASGASKVSWETIYADVAAGVGDYTPTIDQSVLVTIQAKDDGVSWQHVVIVYDNVQMGNP